MKHFLLLFVTSFTILCSSQTKQNNISKLSTTAKIWGFLKYYHPKIAKGEIDWDKELLDILPLVQSSKNKKELSTIYINWITSLGEVEICENCTSVDNENYFGKNFDLDWIEDTNQFSQELIEKLKFIEKNRFQGDHHYIYAIEGIGNLIINNEKEYPSYNWEDQNLRLLTLFRYWNYIEYFFPYKYQMDKDWDTVLEESVLNFLNPNTETAYHLALLELFRNTNDTHALFYTNLTNKYFKSYAIPAKSKIINNKVVLTQLWNNEPETNNEWKIGDVILEVNGKKIKSILKNIDKYIHGSNSSAKLRNAASKIYNGEGDSLKIKFERNGKTSIKKIKYKQFNKAAYKKEKWKIIDSNIGYINMGEITKNDVQKVLDTLINTKAIIFDIRNYPRGTMYTIANFLLEKPKEFVKALVPDLSYPGKFKWMPTISCGTNNPKAYKGKVIILVNEDTQSHGEFTTMVLQTAKKAVIIGSQTAGADGNVNHVTLPGDFYTYFSGIGIFYPDGRETQRIGIVPDIEVKPTIKGIKNGIDEVLEKAIEIAK
ncbi:MULTISPECIES: S41 family peptidase [unclassified Cellulophaga]|uniref:S41 family peptidase n=1 Tax=unclassified Cellulophaga TaxID=2634405 RepID=UPI0026E477A4|nr:MULTISPECIES: S41 family peptidase [unclassified Cellulophaga]MDO6491910.1 S41 family peptidase [Cellulophaga sp. 2_MG-2023]MDO6495435.1 S41 family peptidase [Cellulophaga sp. 3_MG-2023]